MVGSAQNAFNRVPVRCEFKVGSVHNTGTVRVASFKTMVSKKCEIRRAQNASLQYRTWESLLFQAMVPKKCKVGSAQGAFNVKDSKRDWIHHHYRCCSLPKWNLETLKTVGPAVVFLDDKVWKTLKTRCWTCHSQGGRYRFSTLSVIKDASQRWGIQWASQDSEVGFYAWCSTLSMVNGTGLPKLVRNSFGHCRIKDRLFAQELNCKFLRMLNCIWALQD